MKSKQVWKVTLAAALVLGLSKVPALDTSVNFFGAIEAKAATTAPRVPWGRNLRSSVSVLYLNEAFEEIKGEELDSEKEATFVRSGEDLMKALGFVLQSTNEGLDAKALSAKLNATMIEMYGRTVQDDVVLTSYYIGELKGKMTIIPVSYASNSQSSGFLWEETIPVIAESKGLIKRKGERGHEALIDEILETADKLNLYESPAYDYDTSDKAPQFLEGKDGKTYEKVTYVGSDESFEKYPMIKEDLESLDKSEWGENQSAPEKGRVPDGRTYGVTYIYKEVNEGNLEIKFVDEDGKELKSTIKEKKALGSEYDTGVSKEESLNVDGVTYEYLKVEGNEKGKIGPGTTSVTYVYKKKVEDPKEQPPKVEDPKTKEPPKVEEPGSDKKKEKSKEEKELKKEKTSKKDKSQPKQGNAVNQTVGKTKKAPKTADASQVGFYTSLLGLSVLAFVKKLTKKLQ